MTAGEVFAVTSLPGGGEVRLTVTLPDREIDADMPAESARWLAHELLTASRLPWPPPPLRFRHRPDDSGRPS